MADVLRAFDEQIRHSSGSYAARVVGRACTDGMWEGWLEFVPLDAGRPDVVVSSVESRQPALAGPRPPSHHGADAGRRDARPHPRLLNVIAAYDLNPAGEDIAWMSDDQLVRFIVVAVEVQLEAPAK